MIRKIVGSKDPVLRRISKPVKKVDKKVTNLIKDLSDTLSAQKDPEGVGLAACQIGINLRVFVMAKGKEIVPVINPEIVEVSKKQGYASHKEHSILEGCLSLPNYYTPLKRATTVKIKYLTPEGKEKVEEFTGFTAQIVQHEIDHLNGIMFVDRLLEQKKTLYKMEGGEWVEVELI
ncbi:peptide deformylase [Candidatus Woesebacteria bacterium RBG_19FT_COMBO_47_8]|uniref:Peptide deformylase n=1 Tax=Candidatus Woesebacteria bacterium RBG_13_46_13 TaxID=1802479 RepID=A0A1F7X4Z4_9BACT|nr:MAG: peptide deformylase [Candidatus Woesebacteria bacterium RBG_13_46_13]OGM18030.1 MAG: peptide deformylase [Candidatus Woesebacteria bacterium RBG_19FT_COMBO_47_8]HJX59456.1 peptide deformylase [Patescibacteria group bacterium]